MAEAERRRGGRAGRDAAAPTLGLGVLSWGRLDRLRASLESYRAEDLFALFDEALVFLPELTADGAALADEFELPYEGSAANLGMLGGYKALAAGLTSDVVLLLANDCPLVEPRAEAERQLALACRAVAGRAVAAFRMRSVAQPGEPYPELAAYRRLHGSGLASTLRRALHPNEARRLAGLSVHVDPAPERRFPDLIARTDECWLSVAAEGLPWTNQAVMVRRDFYMDVIVAEAEAAPTRPRINGFPTIEAEWNSPRWRGSGWRVGIGRGLFSHAGV
jgi:hypothetical protein